MPTLTKLVLDPTGNLSANKIQNEQHSSFDSFSKIIVPVFGNYYGESLVVEDDQGLILTRGTDFACIEYNQTESLKYGKEIYSAIVVPVDTLSVVISYQALGGDSSFKRQELLNIYSSINLTDPPINYTDIQNIPLEFKPEDHIHGMDTVYGFEFIIKTLVRIKKAIETTELPAYGSLLSYVDNIIQQLKDRNEIFYENETPVYVEKFLQGLNKVYFDIENLANLSAATEIDGQRTGTKVFAPSDLTENKYGTLQSLIGLKTVLYKTLLLKQPVGLGYKERQYHLPIRESVIQSPNGATFSYISEASAIDQGIAYDHDLYPIGSAFDTDITITKVSNGTNSRNGVITAHDQKKMQSYLGEISTGNQGKFSWKRITNTDEIDRLIKVIDSHIVDYGNPHEETKFDIGLSEVENLPVVNKEDLRAIRSVHKYLTFDSLLYFMRTFLLQNGKQFAATEKDNQFIIDNCVVVYTPAGVKCKTTCDVIEPRPPTLSKISQACITGREFVLGGYDNETIYTDKLLEGEYNVGTSSTLLQAIKHFSQCCGYVEAPGSVDDYETVEANQIVELGISQNDIDLLNIISDTYWAMTITYPSGETMRQSGVWPSDWMAIHTAGTDTGIVTLNFVFRHYAKSLLTKSYTVVESTYESSSNTVAHLYTDKMFIRTGETAAGELSLYLSSTTIEETSFPITWRKNSTWEVVNYSWLPTTLQRSNGKVSKVSFTIPFIADWDDYLVAEIVVNGDTIQAEPINLKNITVNKTSKTIPLYENNIATGNITISRDNSTGIVTIENITIPSAQNTSDVYFFRTGTSNTAAVGAIIDVWNDLNNDGWYYPLPPGIFGPTLPP